MLPESVRLYVHDIASLGFIVAIVIYVAIYINDIHRIVAITDCDVQCQATLDNQIEHIKEHLDALKEP